MNKGRLVIGKYEILIRYMIYIYICVCVCHICIHIYIYTLLCIHITWYSTYEQNNEYSPAEAVRACLKQTFNYSCASLPSCNLCQLSLWVRPLQKSHAPKKKMLGSDPIFFKIDRNCSISYFVWSSAPPSSLGTPQDVQERHATTTSQ